MLPNANLRSRKDEPAIPGGLGFERRHYRRSSSTRVYFSSIADILIKTLRRTALVGTVLEKAQCGTIRLKLLKIGVQIRVTVRKVLATLDAG